MRLIRSVLRVVRWLVFAYAFAVAVRKSRTLAIAVALWRLLRRRPSARSASRAAAVTFLAAGDPAIYRRRGWRKLQSTATAGRRRQQF